MKKLAIILLGLLLLIVGCSDNNIGEESAGDKPIVYTSFYPLYFIGQELNDNNIDIRTIIPAGSEAHDYEPSLRQIRDVQDGDAFIYIHEDFESWASKMKDSFKDDAIIIRAADYVDLIDLEDHHHEDEEEGHGHNAEIDLHIWLDPENMIKIAEKVKDLFITLDQANENSYQENFQILSNKLLDIDNKYKEDLSNKKTDKIIVSHAAFSYMANKYGFKQIPVSGISPDQEPSPRTIANIIDLAKEEETKYIFLETLASPRTVSVIAEEANLQVLTLNPLEGLTKDEMGNNEDYFSIMYKNLENLVKALVN